MSTDLQWLLLQKQSFIVKRGAEVGQVFSKENGNLRNLHSHKFSGLANSKTVHITDSGNGVQIVSRKQKASPYAVSRAQTTDTIRTRTASRRAIGIAAVVTSKKAGRPDLRTAALAPREEVAVQEDENCPHRRSRKSKASAADDDDDLPDLV
ncbi:ribosomal L28e protein family-domain-containing protein [Mycena galopus ATCC 62051]|nr:ribosomal L28e protein family-domain-containing protein [Mycena galopus ATCC 62051]